MVVNVARPVGVRDLVARAGSPGRSCRTPDRGRPSRRLPHRNARRRPRHPANGDARRAVDAGDQQRQVEAGARRTWCPSPLSVRMSDRSSRSSTKYGPSVSSGTHDARWDGPDVAGLRPATGSGRVRLRCMPAVAAAAAPAPPNRREHLAPAEQAADRPVVVVDVVAGLAHLVVGDVAVLATSCANRS